MKARKEDNATVFPLEIALTAVLARRHKFDPEDARALPNWNFVENEKESRKIFLGIQIFLGTVGALTLIIAGVGVANIMYVTVKDRTRCGMNNRLSSDCGFGLIRSL